MLLDRYAQQGLLINMNFKEQTSGEKEYAFRGELVLVEGEVADQSGRRKPPSSVIGGTVMLTDDAKIKFVAGFLDELAHLELFNNRYGEDAADDMRALFLVPNIREAMQVEFAGKVFVLVPCTDGMVWNELIDLLALEKSDFKGQSAADKVATVAKAFEDFTPKYAKTTYDEALANATDTKREARGPI